MDIDPNPEVGLGPDPSPIGTVLLDLTLDHVSGPVPALVPALAPELQGVKTRIDPRVGEGPAQVTEALVHALRVEGDLVHGPGPDHGQVKGPDLSIIGDVPLPQNPSTTTRVTRREEDSEEGDDPTMDGVVGSVPATEVKMSSRGGVVDIRGAAAVVSLRAALEVHQKMESRVGVGGEVTTHTPTMTPSPIAEVRDGDGVEVSSSQMGIPLERGLPGSKLKSVLSLASRY